MVGRLSVHHCHQGLIIRVSAGAALCGLLGGGEVPPLRHNPRGGRAVGRQRHDLVYHLACPVALPHTDEHPLCADPQISVPVLTPIRHRSDRDHGCAGGAPDSLVIATHKPHLATVQDIGATAVLVNRRGGFGARRQHLAMAVVGGPADEHVAFDTALDPVHATGGDAHRVHRDASVGDIGRRHRAGAHHPYGWVRTSPTGRIPPCPSLLIQRRCRCVMAGRSEPGGEHGRPRK
jgi:hypothetical protein